MSDMTAAAAAALHRAGLAGDFRGFDSFLERLDEHDTNVARGWSIALRAQRWLAEPHAGELPSLGELGAYRGLSEAEREGARVACAHAERAALLAFDWQAHDALVTLHGELAPEGDAWAALGIAWRALLAGQAEHASRVGEEARASAADAGDAALALEASAVRALAAGMGDDRREAIAIARRASRAARTEALPQSEYVVNLALARLRRASGAPHLAARILYALLRVAPRPWSAWMSWELVLAEGFEHAPALDPTDPRASAHSYTCLTSVLRAAAGGDRSALGSARAQLEDTVRYAAPFARDIALLDAMLDHEATPREVEPATRWIRGETDEVPDGLHGVCTEPGREVAYVLVRPDVPPRRVLGLAAPLVQRETRAVELPKTAGRQARTESTIAALALASDRPTDEESLFRAIYGFPFRASVHGGVRDVLYTRVRQRLAGHGSLERAAGSARIVLDGTLLLPDPRCSPPPDNEVLRVLARLGHASPQRTAEALGIPLRTVREILKRLTDEGALRVEKDGRRLEYHLDDTTFAEPTTRADV